MTEAAIVVEGVSKSFGDVHALVDVDLTIEEGKVFGLLGPNGAGKTTLVRILTTLLRPDRGSATVMGLDTVRDAVALRSRIDLAGQFAAVDEALTGYENVEMVGRLYNLASKEAKRRTRDVLEHIDLADAADRPVNTYSGGMRRRLDLAASLVGQPDVMVMDEPTTGLDPRSRLELWEIIEELVERGTTLLLTTQYLEEADRLASRLAVIDHGKLISEGTPDQLKDQLGGDVLEIVVSDRSFIDAAAGILRRFGDDPSTDEVTGKVGVTVGSDTSAVMGALRALEDEGVQVADLQLRRPTLDDVFLTLTGRSAEAAEAESSPAPSGRRARSNR